MTYLSGMAGWLNTLKDTALAATARQFLDARLKEYGKIGRFHIDTKTHKIELSILLDGETNSIEVGILGYQIFEKDGRTSIMGPIGSFTSSRIWLNNVLNKELGGKSFAIPDKLAPYARTLAGYTD